MSLKNGNTVERRMDLASLFCMIGRHGPAVALAVIAVVSVLAGFVIYRTVRGKRTKVRPGGDGRPGEERDKALIQTEEARSPAEEARSPAEEARSPAEEARSPAESTDMSDEGPSDDLKIRHHRPTAEYKPPPAVPPESLLLPENFSCVQDEAAEDIQTREMVTGDEAQKSYKEEKMLLAECQEDKDLYDEDNLQNVLESPACCEQKLHMSEDRKRDDEATADPRKMESHLEEPDVHVCYSKDPENHPEDTSRSKYYSSDLLSLAEDQVIAEQDEMMSSTSEQETNLLSFQMFDVTEEEVMSSQNSDQNHACGQTSDKIQEDVQEDLLSNLADVHMLQQHLQTEENNKDGLTWNEEEDVGKGEVNEEETTPVLDKDVPAPDLMSPKEELQSENAETEVVEVLAEGTLPSHHHKAPAEKMAEEVLSSQESGQRDRSLTGERPVEDVKEDHLNDLTDIGFEQQLQAELKDGPPCGQEDGAVKAEMLDSCDEEQESSSVVLTPVLPEKFGSRDDGLCGATTDADALICGGADFLDLPSDHQQPQSKVTEEQITTELQKETHLDVLATGLLSVKEEILKQGSVDQEANLERCDEETAEESDQNDDRGLTSKAIEDVNEDHLSDLTNVSFDASKLLQTELKNDLPSNQEDGGVKDEILTSLAEQPAPEKTDGVCGTTGEPRCLDVTSDVLLSVKDETAPAADLHILSLDVSSLREEVQSERKEIDTVVVLVEETVHKVMSSSYKDQHSDPNKESLDQMDQASSATPVLSTETPHPDPPSSFQDKQSDQNNADFPEVTAPDINKPLICQIQLPSFEQSELTWSSSGVGGENGVSSMTVNPDMENPVNEGILTSEDADLPAEDRDLQAEVQINLSADDVALSEDAAGVVSKSCPSHLSEPTDWARDESFSTNEDTFGHEVEDSYNRAMDQFVMEIVAKVKHDKKKKQMDIKAVETKEGAKEEDDEKTEISIMEATMDNNEWITDGNYQVLPGMNFSVPSFIQNHRKSEAVPREEHLHSCSPANARCTDAVIPAAEQTNTVSFLDESWENSKKVVAVQPMPQNVSVIFRIHYHTHSPYQKVAVTGNQQELGNWKEFIPLERGEDGQWSSRVSLPADRHVEWKFVVVDKGDVCRWEECGNRLLDTGSGDELLVHRWWGIL